MRWNGGSRGREWWGNDHQREEEFLVVVLTGRIATAPPLLRGLEEEPARYFVHFGIQAEVEPERLLSTKVSIGERFYAGGGDFQELSGIIELRGGQFHAELKGNIGSQGGFFVGALTNGIPVFAQGGSFSGGVAPIWFAISTNGDSGDILRALEERQVER